MSESHRRVFFNGELVHESEAKISIYDSALMVLYMFIEMTRYVNKKQFNLKEHIERLYTGCRLLRIPLELAAEEMEKACYQTIEANNHLFGDDDEHRLMIDVSRGLLGIYNGIEEFNPGQI